MALKRIQKVSAGGRPGAPGRARVPARTDPGALPERLAGRARDGRVSRGGCPRPETRAGPAGTGLVMWEQGPVPGGWRCLEAGGPRRSRWTCALTPRREAILLCLQISPKSGLHSHHWIFALHRASFGLCHAVFSFCCFLIPFSFMFLLPRAPC